ncbi:MAG: hypothetical protein B6242_10965 [Anaerolineaceae bacterium 4572_78]|nr:MAG: hypothetical protein B6242_10965 [Anaerolineaceae bacterium 4572_78]
MSKKSNYGRKDWKVITSTPVLVGAGVSDADESFLSSVSEMEILYDFLDKSKAQYMDDEFMSDILSNINKDWNSDWNKLKNAVAVIDSKVSAEEAQTLKEFMYKAAVTVAEAYHEGWFSKNPISKKEAAYLAQLKKLLNI